VSEEIRYGHLFHFVPVFLGLGASIWFATPGTPEAWVLAAILAALSLPLFRSARGTPVHIALWGACLICIGMLLAEWEARRLSTVILDQPVVTTVSGIIERREQGSAGEWRYTLRITSTSEPTIRRPPERVNLLARSKHGPAAIGDGLSGRARLSPPSGPALPGLNDFAFQSYFAGIGAVGFFLGPPLVQPPIPGNTGSVTARFDAALFSLRDRISNRIRSLLPGDPGAFAASIITGERRSMSDEATDALRVSGLAHITAISGLNMALAAGIFFVGLRGVLSLFPVVAQRYPIKKIAAVDALVATTGYVLISGYQVSALRAYLMTAIMLIAVLSDRPAISLRNLALAATAIICVQPSTVMGPSFQMSFAATAGLIAGYAGWRARPRAILPPARSLGFRIVAGGATFVGGTLATSLIGGLATAIFAITHFHRLSTHGLEANLAAMPLISLVVMPAGFIAMLMMPLGLDQPFFWVMGQGLELVLLVAHTVAGWGGGYVFPRLPSGFLLGTIAGMLILTLLRTRLRHVGTVLILATVTVTWFMTPQKTGEVLISEDGRFVAVLTENQDEPTLAVNRARPPEFIFDQWKPVLGIEAALPPTMLAIGELPPAPDWRLGETWTAAQQTEAAAILDRMIAATEERHFVCIKQACALKISTRHMLVTVDRPELVGAACDRATLVVLAARTRLQRCRSGATLISQTSLRTTGALEIFGLDEARNALTIRPSFDGAARPWTAHRLYDWRTATSLADHTVIPPSSPGWGQPALPADKISDSVE
jgi:ComEC/Rec2-related protein